ncbi:MULTISPECIES: glycosyltransferase [Bradyrhizobium]|uniref:glycosyltransferase n=1 Tax=Bradyrhizobium pachyrhizi TaxID=280333 RepID=UPI0004051EAA
MGKEEQATSKGNAAWRPPARTVSSMFAIGPKFVARAFAVAVRRNLPHRTIAFIRRYRPRRPPTVIKDAYLFAWSKMARIRQYRPRRPPTVTFKDAYLFAWSKMARCRPLLARDPAELSMVERVERGILKLVLAMPDGRHRRALRQFGIQLERQGVSAARRSIAQQHGVTMMIGTLGPGGAERQLVVTARGLREGRKPSIRVACVNLSSPVSRFFLPELESRDIAASVIGTEVDSNLEPARRAVVDALPPELRDDVALYAKTLAAQNPEIAHLWLDEVNIKGGIAAVLTGVPKIIISQRSLPPINFVFHQPYMRESYRWLARQPGVKMINNSAAGARAYEAWLGLAKDSIGVVRNGYAFDESELAGYKADCAKLRQRVGIEPGAQVVGTVMRFTEEKCPMLWLEIAALIRRELLDVRFLIVGDGPLRAVMEARAAADDLAGAVFFAGHLKESMAAIASMDLMLLTSRAEGLPNVLVEAQFLGVPAVTTPAGGAPEAVNHGKSGWVLQGWDAASSACQIVRLLRDGHWREAAAKDGPEFAFKRFGVQRAIDETLAMYG